MSEDLTQNLPTSFQERVLAEFAALNVRFTKLEDRITAIEDRMISVEGRMTSFEDRMISFEDRMASVENRMTAFESRMTAFESRMTSLGDRALSIDTRLTSLEEKVDARLHETRPIWESVQQRLTGVEAELNNLNRQIRALLADMFQMRVRVDKLEENQQPL